MRFNLLAFLFIASNSAFASEVPDLWDHPSAMAMGGAYTSIANDDSSFWTNPAGIARTKKARSKDPMPLLRTPNFTYGANNFDVTKGISKLASTSQRMKLLTDALSSTNGSKPVWLAAGLEFLGVSSSNAANPVGFVLYSHTTSQIQVDSEDITGSIDANTKVRTNVLSDTGALINFAFADKSNRASFSLQARYIASRFSLSAKTPVGTLTNVSEFNDELKPNASKTKGLAVDMGLLYTYPDFWFPTIGVAIFNLPLGCQNDYLNSFSENRETVCGTVFKGTITNEDDPRTIDPTDIRIGFSMNPRFSKNLSTRLALDLHHQIYSVGTKNYGLKDIPINRQIHAGMDIFFGNPLTPSPFRLKIGLNQTFLTLGANVALGNSTTLDFARYGKDIASGPTSRSDTRYVMNLGFKN